ncbi:MAG: sensor histidine kinase [Vallitaleaceae bacterium]|nr:sensor histidine kinase [Vallitaleaceae bacterium]
MDKIVLFFSCAIVYLSGTTDNFSVIPLIIGLTGSSLLSYFDHNKPLRFLTYVIFFTISFYYGDSFFFAPLVIYDLITENEKPLLLLPLFSLVQFFTQYNLPQVFLIFIILSLAIFIRTKSTDLLGYRKKYFDLLDTTNELSEKLQKQHHDLLEKQDDEIHIATLNERNRIAREIHDNVGHQLSSSLLQIGALMVLSKEEDHKNHLRIIKETLSSAMDSIRNSVHNLYDTSIDLEAQIRELTQSFSYCEVQLDCDLRTSPNQKQKFAFIAIVKEALNNIVKHSNASKVFISFREHPGLYQLIIRDNGSNFDRSENTLLESLDDFDASHGIGLRNMKFRVESLNGHIHLRYQDGFEIFISIPKG